jgi:hypothetical protein
MGITGENFAPEVKTQVEQRQKYYAKAIKDDLTVQTQNPNAWLRLASSVDLNAVRDQFTTQGEYLLADDRATELTNYFGVMAGSELARLFVLTGGTAYYDDQDKKLYDNSGIGRQAQGVYQKAYGFEGTDFGYRPMPAIESADIQFYNDGALAKADIQIICNSPRQLDALEILYLRPGYTILLEWGHSTFVNNQGESENLDATGYITEPFSQFFEGGTGVDRETIQKALVEERLKKSYNYDGFHGVITNFSWTLNKDATYKVTIKAVTTGAVIESLKIASNFNIDSPKLPASTGSLNLQSVSEKLLARAKESDTYAALAAVVEKLEPQGGGQTPDLLQTLYPLDIELALNITTLDRDFPAGGAQLPSGEYWEPPYGSVLGWKYESGGVGSIHQQLYYITFDAFLAHLQCNCILYTGTGKPYIRFDIGMKDSIPMLSVPARFSSDPTVCIINFDKVVNSDQQFTKKEKLYYSKLNDVVSPSPWTFGEEMDNSALNLIEFNKRKTTRINNLGIGGGFGTVLFPTGSDLSSNFQKDHLTGYLGSVHVNIEHIAALFDKCAEDDGTTKLINILQKLVNDISDALGGINDFKVKFNEETRTVRIYDQALRSRENTKTFFRSYGVKTGTEATIVKDLSITTQLSNEMSNMIAVGAQANANILSENATAFSKFNAGLLDRVTQAKVSTNSLLPKTPFEKFLEVSSRVLEYIQVIYPVGNKGFNINNGNIKTLNKLNKDYCRYLLGHYSTVEIEMETPFIIPFKMMMTIPGLSGGTIYQKFGMDDLLLPFSYQGKIDYLIINVEHSIQKNIWDTKYTAYTIPIPTTGSVTGLSVSGLPTVSVSVGAGTFAVDYIPDPDPDYRADAIYGGYPWTLIGSPNSGTHKGTWYNSNAYDLAPVKPIANQAVLQIPIPLPAIPTVVPVLNAIVPDLPIVNVYAPTNLIITRVVNYGPSIQIAGPLKLYGQGILAKNPDNGHEIYLGHLGAINSKVVTGATLEKGEFLGTVQSANGQVQDHVHIGVSFGNLFTDWIQQDISYDFTFQTWVLQQVRGNSYRGTFY